MKCPETWTTPGSKAHGSEDNPHKCGREPGHCPEAHRCVCMSVLICGKKGLHW